MLENKFILALDIGLKHTGCAFFSSETGIAIPLSIINHHSYQELLILIDRLIKHYNITDILIGLPYSHLKGENEQINIVKSYIKQIKINHKTITFHTTDERFTTQVVNKGDDSLAALEMLNTAIKRGLTN